MEIPTLTHPGEGRDNDMLNPVHFAALYLPLLLRLINKLSGIKQIDLLLHVLVYTGAGGPLSNTCLTRNWPVA